MSKAGSGSRGTQVSTRSCEPVLREKVVMGLVYKSSTCTLGKSTGTEEATDGWRRCMNPRAFVCSSSTSAARQSQTQLRNSSLLRGYCWQRMRRLSPKPALAMASAVAPPQFRMPSYPSNYDYFTRRMGKTYQIIISAAHQCEKNEAAVRQAKLLLDSVSRENREAVLVVVQQPINVSRISTVRREKQTFE